MGERISSPEFKSNGGFMFKICVIGCGGMSSGGHGPSYKKYKEDYKDVCLAACCDLDEEKAKEYKEKFGFEKYYTNYDEMFEKENPDVVCLMAPVSLTKKLSVDIMKKGYNIIMEKPPGANVSETKEMIEAGEESGVFVRCAFNRRYAPLVIKLKECIKNKRIYNITYQMYRHSRKESTFYTTAIHAIDAVKNIVGSDYKKINITFQELPEIGEGVANFYLDCDFENGVKGFISLVPQGGAVVERITVNTPDESWFVELPFWNNLDVPGRIRGIKKNEVFFDVSGAELAKTGEMFEEMGFYEENRSFFELIKSGVKPYSDLKSGLQSMEIAECLEKRISVYENK